ncbi:universal stress protein [Bradyrhizobium sp. sBnM-33]|uniref:universal stress protein n=1 Tax=Bradyrhizobium sp. sBnM-33 TaxID=2831780 RepID=UPI001BCF5220|nr:universal stress protein [Bradyrhizobium sp. sBnM-33]WOH53273.1 universal stress protein [Bradyrhizobium sp. sBnM-33]
MKDVLLITTPVYTNAPGQATNYACALARLVGAHVTAWITEIESDPATGMIEPDLMQVGDEVAEQLAKECVPRTVELVQDAASRAGVTCTVVAQPPSSALREKLIDTAQARDVVIFDVCRSLRHPRQGLVQAALFGSGRPIILVPGGAHTPAAERVLVAWDGTRSAARALHDALPVLTHAREVVVTTVADDKERRVSESGDEVCRYLGRWGVRARFDLLQRGNRSVGDILLGHAAEIEAGLVVMGGFAHDMEREFLFGGATRNIFQSALQIPVLLSH